MLHIILIILKIIGWILLAILGLIVLLICVTLFVPLKYRGDASCKGTLDSLYGKIRFSWLAHLVRGFAVYENGELNWSIRIAWKKISGDDEAPPPEEEEDFPYNNESHPEGDETKERGALPKKEREAANETPKPEASDAQLLEQHMRKKESSKAEEGKKEQAAKTENGKKEQVAKWIDAEKKKNLRTAAREEKGGPEASDTGSFQKIQIRYNKIMGKIQAFYKKIKYTFHNICDTIKSLLEKKDKLQDFITDEIHQSAFLAALAEIRRMLRFLKPKKLKADVHFGFEDPAITGNVLAIISMIYPFIGKHADIQPDFDQQILEGHLLVAGKVRPLYAGIIFWNLFWNKNVRTTFRHIRKFNL